MLFQSLWHIVQNQCTDVWKLFVESIGFKLFWVDTILCIPFAHFEDIIVRDITKEVLALCKLQTIDLNLKPTLISLPDHFHQIIFSLRTVRPYPCTCNSLEEDWIIWNEDSIYSRTLRSDSRKNWISGSGDQRHNLAGIKCVYDAETAKSCLFKLENQIRNTWYHHCIRRVYRQPSCLQSNTRLQMLSPYMAPLGNCL